MYFILNGLTMTKLRNSPGFQNKKLPPFPRVKASSVKRDRGYWGREQPFFAVGFKNVGFVLNMYTISKTLSKISFLSGLKCQNSLLSLRKVTRLLLLPLISFLFPMFVFAAQTK